MRSAAGVQPTAGEQGRPQPPPPGLVARTEALKRYARQLGFVHVGISAAAAALTHGFYTDWLQQGHAAGMAYLWRHAPLKADPRSLLEQAQAIISLAWPYAPPAEADPPGAIPPPGAPLGRVAAYAVGEDYHTLLHARLARLAEFLARLLPPAAPFAWRAVVDSAPLLEREFAVRGGLGWVGKNAMLIHPRSGSYLLLAELLVSCALRPDAPRPPRQGAPAAVSSPFGGALLHDGCGSCTACLQACPTGAIVAPKQIDSRRCISYLTIEHKGSIPASLRPALGDWLFGCDLCQQACPWNPPPRPSAGQLAGPNPQRLHLPTLLALSPAEFKHRFRGSALLRPKRSGLLRNAAIVLGNLWRRRQLTPLARQEAHAALKGALQDPDPIIQQAAAWSLHRVF